MMKTSREKYWLGYGWWTACRRQTQWTITWIGPVVVVLRKLEVYTEI